MGDQADRWWSDGTTRRAEAGQPRRGALHGKGSMGWWAEQLSESAGLALNEGRLGGLDDQADDVVESGAVHRRVTAQF